MRLSQLLYLDAVIRYGSFHKAATALRVAQPTLSAQIAALEQELSVQLLKRSAAGSTPTPIGYQIHEHIRTILSEIDEIYATCRRAEPIELRIGVIPSVEQSGCLGELPTRLAATHPGVRLEVHQKGALHMARMIENGELDVGCLTWTDRLDEEFPGIQVSKVTPGRIMAAVSRHHPLAANTWISLRDIVNYPLVLFPEGYLMHLLVRRALERSGMPYQLLCYSENGGTLVQTIRTGKAVGFLYALDSLLPLIAGPDAVVEIPVSELPDVVWLSVATRNSRHGQKGHLIRDVAQLIAALISPPGTPATSVSQNGHS